jgi:ATP-dependent exoDNAse (exonuclease V) alpha subunit
VKDLYDGNARDALQSLKDRGRLHVFSSRDEAMKKMVEDWGKKKDRNDPMFAPTHVEVDQLNKECQKLRLKNQELKTWETLHANGQKFYINDRIMFERTADQYGVNNGDLGTITGFNSKQKLLAARLDDGRKVLIHTDKYPEFSLGYAMTAHKGQGTTVENTFVLLGGSLQDQHLAYVQLSRARGVTQVYVDRFEAGDNLDGLEQSLTRSNPDLLAREYVDGHAQKHRRKGFGYDP